MSEKPTTIKQRVLMICDEQTVSKTKFFTQFGQSYSNFTGRDKKSPISSDFLTRMVIKYPNYNLKWLLTGVGDMVNVNEVKELELENKELKNEIKLLKEELKK